MGISPWYKTAMPTAPTWTIELVPDSGAFSVLGLSTGNFAMLFRDLDTGVETTGAGTFSSLQAAVTTTINGQSFVVSPASIQYQVAQTEVVVSRKHCYVLVTLPGGQIQPFELQEDWIVRPI